MGLRPATEKENKLKREFFQDRLLSIAGQLVEMADVFDSILFLVPNEPKKSMSQIRKETAMKLKEMEVKYGSDRRRIRE